MVTYICIHIYFNSHQTANGILVCMGQIRTYVRTDIEKDEFLGEVNSNIDAQYDKIMSRTEAKDTYIFDCVIIGGVTTPVKRDLVIDTRLGRERVKRDLAMLLPAIYDELVLSRAIGETNVFNR